MAIAILNGKAEVVLRTLPDNSVDLVVTSPPYYGQRDYGVDGQIGLEDSFGAYLAKLVIVFEEVRRVLKPSGCMFLNMGDAYVNDGGSGRQGNTGDRLDRRHTQARLIPQVRDLGLKPKSLIGQPWRLAFALMDCGWIPRQEIIWLKGSPTPESAVDRPTRAHETIFLFTKAPQYFYDAFAVMEPTTGNSHSRGSGSAVKNRGMTRADGVKHNLGGATSGVFSMRNQRSVWTINSTPFGDEWCTACKTLYSATEKKKLDRDEKDRLICKCGRVDAWVAHFASFPKRIPELSILAGSSEAGCCMWCGAPQKRIVERPKGRGTDQHPDQELKKLGVKRMMKSGAEAASPDGARRLMKMAGLRELTDEHRRAEANRVKGNVLLPRAHDVTVPAPKHIGWKSTCKKNCPGRAGLGGLVPAVVLDPFMGAGSTMMVAEQLGRNSIGIEINSDYCDMAEARIRREITGVEIQRVPCGADPRKVPAPQLLP